MSNNQFVYGVSSIDGVTITPLKVNPLTGNIGISFTYLLVTATANYSAVVENSIILVNAQSSAITITLPTAINNSGLEYIIKKTDSSPNSVTITTTSSQSIDGSPSLTFSTQYQSYTMISDGSNWQII